MNNNILEIFKYFFNSVLCLDVEFPKRYPTGCLLGCVNLTDCLSQEEYISRYPQGENESPFIFICEDPVLLANYFPIKGQHKICKCLTQIRIFFCFYYYYLLFSVKLDEKICNAAQKCLMKEIS